MEEFKFINIPDGKWQAPMQSRRNRASPDPFATGHSCLAGRQAVKNKSFAIPAYSDKVFGK